MTQDLRQAALLAKEALEDVFSGNGCWQGEFTGAWLASARHALRSITVAIGAEQPQSAHLAAADSEGVSGSDVPARPTSPAEDERARFEAWMRVKHPAHPLDVRPVVNGLGGHYTGDPVEYLNSGAQHKWLGWQARAASPPLPQEQGAVPPQGEQQ
jgi:hypothetical protein